MTELNQNPARPAGWPRASDTDARPFFNCLYPQSRARSLVKLCKNTVSTCALMTIRLCDQPWFVRNGQTIMDVRQDGPSCQTAARVLPMGCFRPMADSPLSHELPGVPDTISWPLWPTCDSIAGSQSRPRKFRSNELRWESLISEHGLTKGVRSKNRPCVFFLKASTRGLLTLGRNHDVNVRIDMSRPE